MTVHDLARALPDIARLRDRCRAVAMLDAILSPDVDSRYYCFTTRWVPGVDLASMDNGSGDAYSIVFSAAGVFIRGFDHESPMSPVANDHELWPGLVDTVPEAFSAWIDEPAFGYDGMFDATVCLWRRSGDDRWRAGNIDFPDGRDPDGADHLFAVLADPTPRAYQRFAADYYERTVDHDAVGTVLAMCPLADALVQRLNPDRAMADLVEDLAKIGYPS